MSLNLLLQKNNKGLVSVSMGRDGSYVYKQEGHAPPAGENAYCPSWLSVTEDCPFLYLCRGVNEYHTRLKKTKTKQKSNRAGVFQVTFSSSLYLVSCSSRQKLHLFFIIQNHIVLVTGKVVNISTWLSFKPLRHLKIVGQKII